MAFGLIKLIQIGAIVIILLGAAFSTLLNNFIKCAKTLSVKTEQCKNFAIAVGNILFTPQVKISESIDALQPENLNTIPDSVRNIYINSVRADLFFSLLVSAVHLYLIYKIFVSMPAFADWFVMAFAMIISLSVWLALQGWYASSVLGLPFLTPFQGLVKLFSNLDLVFGVATEQAKTVGTELVEPI